MISSFAGMVRLWETRLAKVPAKDIPMRREMTEQINFFRKELAHFLEIERL